MHKIVGWVMFTILVVEVGLLVFGAFAGVYFAWKSGGLPFFQ